MADKSAIEWTDATVNFWWGCTKVGPGCYHCYAEAWAKRTGGSHWGIGVPRRKIAGAAKLIHRLDNNYAEWAADRECGLCGPHAGLRRRVFIQSMSDLFDLEVDVEWFREAWGLIHACKRLDIQIVTKRISAVEKRLTEAGATAWPDHVGLIITVVNQEEANRDIPRLLSLKQRLCIPWIGLSCEPLLGPIDISDFNHRGVVGGHNALIDRGLGKVDWVIAGGESGRKARSIHPAWARSLRDQCAAAAVPFFFKQWGEWAPSAPEDAAGNPQSGWKALGAYPHVAKAAELYPEAGAEFIARVGKKAAGRLLDGVEHNGFPARAAP